MGSMPRCVGPHVRGSHPGRAPPPPWEGGRIGVQEGRPPGPTPYREGVPVRIRGLNSWLQQHPTVSNGFGALLVLAIGIPQLLLQPVYSELGYRPPDLLQIAVL